MSSLPRAIAHKVRRICARPVDPLDEKVLKLSRVAWVKSFKEPSVGQELSQLRGQRTKCVRAWSEFPHNLWTDVRGYAPLQTPRKTKKNRRGIFA